MRSRMKTMVSLSEYLLVEEGLSATTTGTGEIRADPQGGLADAIATTCSKGYNL